MENTGGSLTCKGEMNDSRKNRNQGKSGNSVEGVVDFISKAEFPKVWSP